jgi:hypothetical protein
VRTAGNGGIDLCSQLRRRHTDDGGGHLDGPRRTRVGHGAVLRGRARRDCDGEEGSRGRCGHEAPSTAITTGPSGAGDVGEQIVAGGTGGHVRRETAAIVGDTAAAADVGLLLDPLAGRWVDGGVVVWDTVDRDRASSA